MSKPPQTRNRLVVTFTLSQEVVEYLAGVAAASGRSRSAVVEEAVRYHRERVGAGDLAAVFVQLDELRAQINRRTAMSSACTIQRYVDPRHVEEALADVQKWVEQHQQELRDDADPEKRVRASAWAFVSRNFTSKPEDVWPNALDLAGRSLAFMARSDAGADVLLWINSHSGRLEELGDGERLERRVDLLADWIFYYAVYIDLEGARDGALEMAALATFFMARSRA